MSVNIEERKKWNLKPGNTVKVWSKIREGEKVRLQAFEGLILSHKHGFEPGATFTVRKIASSVGVERVFPIFSPNIEKIEITKKAKVRRSKLYYIRDKSAKKIRKKIKQIHEAFVKKVKGKKTEKEIEVPLKEEKPKPTEDTKPEVVEAEIVKATDEAKVETEEKVIDAEVVEEDKSAE